MEELIYWGIIFLFYLFSAYRSRQKKVEGEQFQVPDPLPQTENKMNELRKLLVQVGANSVFSIRSMVENLIRKVEEGKSFSNKRIFHLVHLLKAYGLVAPPQLDLFEKNNSLVG